MTPCYDEADFSLLRSRFPQQHRRQPPRLWYYRLIVRVCACMRFQWLFNAVVGGAVVAASCLPISPLGPRSIPPGNKSERPTSNMH